MLNPLHIVFTMNKNLDKIINIIGNINKFPTYNNVFEILSLNLQKDLFFDSIDIIELIMETEKEFGIKIYEDTEFENRDYTIKEIIDFISNKINEKIL